MRLSRLFVIALSYANKKLEITLLRRGTLLQALESRFDFRIFNSPNHSSRTMAPG
jgi:hypothetical protein